MKKQLYSLAHCTLNLFKIIFKSYDFIGHSRKSHSHVIVINESNKHTCIMSPMLISAAVVLQQNMGHPLSGYQLTDHNRYYCRVHRDYNCLGYRRGGSGVSGGGR
jgi:hypothetical protein